MALRNPSKSKFFEPLAVAVAGGAQIKSVAGQIGCSVAHAHDISRRDEFKLRVSELRSEALQAAMGRLSKLALDAAEVLADGLSRDEMTPDELNQYSKARLPAAKALLASLLPLSEHLELRQRVDELEAKSAKPRVIERKAG